MVRRNRLAERLKELRKAKGLTQRDMARQFRLTDVGYGGWERGDTEPSIDNIMRLCEFFGCTADSLIGLPPPPPDNGKRLEDLKGRLNALLRSRPCVQGRRRLHRRLIPVRNRT